MVSRFPETTPYSGMGAGILESWADHLHVSLTYCYSWKTLRMLSCWVFHLAFLFPGTHSSDHVMTHAHFFILFFIQILAICSGLPDHSLYLNST